MRCELCEREVGETTVHHLVPRQKKGTGGPTAALCSACHRQIHTFFDNRQLARELNSLERLRAEPRMQRFLAWLRKQDPGLRVKVRGARE